MFKLRRLIKSYQKSYLTWSQNLESKDLFEDLENKEHDLLDYLIEKAKKGVRK